MPSCSETHGQLEEEAALAPSDSPASCCSTTRNARTGPPRRNRSPTSGRGPDRDASRGRRRRAAERPAELTEAELGRVERRVDPLEPDGQLLVHADRRESGHRRAGQWGRAPRRRTRPRAGRARRWRWPARPVVGAQPVGQRPAGEPAAPAEHQRGAGPERSPARTATRVIAGNTRSSSGSRRIRPAQNQQADDQQHGDQGQDLAGGGTERLAARCRPTCRRAAMPNGTNSTKRRAKRAPACLARASLRPCGVLDPVLDQVPRGDGRGRCRRRCGPPAASRRWRRRSGRPARPSARCRVRSKSVEISHSRWAASNAGPHLLGARRRPRTGPGGSNGRATR